MLGAYPPAIKTNPEPCYRLRYRPRRRSPAPGPFFSIRILINWRRPDLAIDASADARADRSWRAVRQDIRLRLTGIANDKGSMDMPMLLLGCLGHGWCHRHRCRYGQCQKSDRKFAHASLPGQRGTETALTQRACLLNFLGAVPVSFSSRGVCVIPSTWPAHIPAGFSRVKAPPNYQLRNRLNLTWSSISRPRRYSAYQCRRRFSLAPTR